MLRKQQKSKQIEIKGLSEGRDPLMLDWKSLCAMSWEKIA